MVALYCVLNFLFTYSLSALSNKGLTYWFISDVFPTLGQLVVVSQWTGDLPAVAEDNDLEERLLSGSCHRGDK
jgi:hypothetical protein